MTTAGGFLRDYDQPHLQSSVELLGEEEKEEKVPTKRLHG